MNRSLIYTPWTSGRYTVAPALRPFGTDFGNGEWDRQVFQFDSSAELALANKRVALAEDPNKYVCRADLSPEVESAARDFVRSQLRTSTGASLDELMLEIPDDLGIVMTEGDRDWIAYLHLCAPSDWAATDKIGLSFFATHQPIPEFGPVNRGASGLVTAMIDRGPWVRFVWGLETSTRLNRHPVAPIGVDAEEWEGRRFDREPFTVRVERQVIWPLPEVRSSLFFIRVHFVDQSYVLADETLRESLRNALHSMSPGSREYKGVSTQFDHLIEQLSIK